MTLSETELFDLLQTSPSFRRSCAHTLAVLLAGEEETVEARRVEDESNVQALVDFWE